MQKCEKCECEKFKEVMYVFKVSKLLTGEPQDSIVPVPTFACIECGHVNEEFDIKRQKKIDDSTQLKLKV